MLVYATSYAQATERILDWARAAESRYVSAASVNNVMEAHDSRDFGRIMDQADLITPDGMPLVWGLRLLGARGARRVYGPQLTVQVLGAAAREGIPVGLYGSTPEVLERLLSVLHRRWPRLGVACVFAPPFRPLTESEDAAVVVRYGSRGLGFCSSDSARPNRSAGWRPIAGASRR